MRERERIFKDLRPLTGSAHSSPTDRPGANLTPLDPHTWLGWRCVGVSLDPKVRQCGVKATLHRGAITWLLPKTRARAVCAVLGWMDGSFMEPDLAYNAELACPAHKSGGFRHLADRGVQRECGLELAGSDLPFPYRFRPSLGHSPNPNPAQGRNAWSDVASQVLSVKC